jgi:hypothetical protein
MSSAQAPPWWAWAHAVLRTKTMELGQKKNKKNHIYYAKKLSPDEMISINGLLLMWPLWKPCVVSTTGTALSTRNIMTITYIGKSLPIDSRGSYFFVGNTYFKRTQKRAFCCRLRCLLLLPYYQTW